MQRQEACVAVAVRVQQRQQQGENGLAFLYLKL